MTQEQTERVSGVILAAMKDTRSVRDLQSYFGLDGSGAFFSGRLFQRLGGRGDDAAYRDVLTASDLLAVETLSVQVPSLAAWNLLHGDSGREISDLLSQIPTNVAIGSADAQAHLADDSPASKAWARLRRENGIDFVTAGKLLARKRPLLVPIYDNVIRCFLGEPEHPWMALHEALASAPVHEEVSRVRSEAGVPDDEADLRLVDVVLWMAHQEDHRRGKQPVDPPL